MQLEANHPDFARELEIVEARMWESLQCVTASEPLYDSHGAYAGTALFTPHVCALGNRVVGLGLERPVSTEVLERIVELYEARGAESIFIPTTPTVRPASLPRILKGFGFEPAMKEAKLYRNTENPPAMDPHDRVVKATDADYEAVLNVYRRAGMEPEWAEVVSGNLESPNWHHYMALDGARPVALATFYVQDGFAMMFPGWTLPEYRHRGYQRALGAYRIAAARELGCAWVSVNLDVTDNPIGFTIRSYTRLGYELLYVRTTHIRQRPNVPLPDAYGRRMLVPQG